MKINHLLAIILWIASSVITSAQNSISFFSNQHKNSVENVFNTVEFTYSPVTQKQIKDKYNQTTDETAFALSYAQARQVLDSHPLYVQYGLGLQYAYHINEDQDDVDYNGTLYSGGFNVLTSFFTAKIPVNVLYTFEIPETRMTFMPYAGLHLLGHLVGQQKDTEWFSVNGDRETTTEKTNLFSSEDMGDHKLNRFIIGWQVGAKMAFNKFLIGVAYEGPMSNLEKSDTYTLRRSQTNISIGIMF